MDHNDHERYYNQKRYSKEGESESHVAAGVALVVCFIMIVAWLFLLWLAGFICH